MLGRWVDPRDSESEQSKLRERLATEYLTHVIAALNVLDVGSPSELVMSMVKNVPGSPIVDVWTPPKVRTVPSITADKEWLRMGGIERRFELVFENLDEPLRVLLGDPGYGKTTAAKYLAILFADKFIKGNGDYVPVYVPLRYVDSAKENLIEEIILTAVRHAGCESSFDLLIQSLTSKNVKPFIIFDGLDERLHADTRANPAAGLVISVRNAYPASHILATCRVFDYIYDEGNRIAHGSHYLLSEFSIPQIESTVRSWHEQASKVAGLIGHSGKDYRSRGESLIDFIKSDTEIQKLAQTPLLLNLMQVLYRPETSLPRSIPNICRRAINYLFIERPLLRGEIIGQSDDKSTRATDLSRDEFEEYCWIILQRLAHLVYGKGVLGKSKTILWSELTQIIEQAIGANTPEGFQNKGELVYPIQKHFIAGHGVLTDINKQAFVFVHNLFQDVLAGLHFQILSDSERLELAQSIKWQPAIRCWANLAAEERTTRAESILFADQLFRLWRAEASRFNCLLNAAAISIEIRQRSNADLGDTLNDELVKNISDALLVALDDDEQEFEQRVLIGDLLGGLGDPRVPSNIEETTKIELWYIELASGSFTIGRGTPHSCDSPKYEEVTCCPAIKVECPRMLIARFPVTNGEYRLFLEDGGYHNLSYWRSPGGAKWVQGEDQFIDELHNLVMSSSLKHFKTEIDAGRLCKEDIEDLVQRMLRRAEPLYWYDSRFNKPNQPVVGINWWEAVAYCSWLEAQIRKHRRDISSIRVQLPSEFEWERSGRPSDDSRPYPWGVDTSDAYALVGEKQQAMARTGPVGLYPSAQWENGPLDMVGTVWNWTRSPKSDYAQWSGSEQESLEPLAERIVRGGSWLSRERESRCLTFRSFDPPCNAYEDLGFRAAIQF